MNILKNKKYVCFGDGITSDGLHPDKEYREKTRGL